MKKHHCEALTHSKEDTTRKKNNTKQNRTTNNNNKKRHQTKQNKKNNNQQQKKEKGKYLSGGKIDFLLQTINKAICNPSFCKQKIVVSSINAEV